MSDVHSPKIRSYNMSKIKGKNTKPELIVRSFLFSEGLRYRLHNRKLPGKPDLVLRKHKTVVFINGCFWHGHKGCKYFVLPKTRTDWWKNKIMNTQIRDTNNIEKLENLGWNTITVWECELKKEKRERTLQRLYTDICKD